MSFDGKTLYDLLPAIYRIRDAEQGEPLRALLEVIGREAGVLEENLAQLYDDQFVETCASWVLPYIGDLIGLTSLPGTGAPGLSPRAEVARTIAYRRRKGTAAMLEQLAHDVTGWPAHAVEFFQLISATQHMNHLRPGNQSFISVRGAERLEYLDSAFEGATTPGDPDLTHTVDVRRIAKGHGRYNIPNVGLFLWRLRPMPLTLSPAVSASTGDRRHFFFSALGIDTPLFNLPETEAAADHLADPVNVPDRIRRRALRRSLDDYYGKGRSLVLSLAGPNTSIEPEAIPSSQITVCDLTDWGNLPVLTSPPSSTSPPVVTSPPTSLIAIDPVLGRIAFPQDPSGELLVTFHYGFSANMGGGEYSRLQPGGLIGGVNRVANTYVNDAFAQRQGFTRISDALSALGSAGGTVEIVNSGRYAETLTINATGRSIELRAADKRRPAIILGADLLINGGTDDEVILDGLLISGGALQVNGLRRLRLRHCTLVPGTSIAVDASSSPPTGPRPSLVVKSANTRIEIDRCILGGIRTNVDAEVVIQNSIVDATDETLPAYDGIGSFGAPLQIANSTVIGLVRTSVMRLATNTIFMASIAAGRRRTAPVQAERRQEGCVRFSYVSRGARLPARYHCQPESESSLVRPQFVSTHYRDPGYCQLSPFCPTEIRQGADDEASMGAFHDLLEPKREAHLRADVEEYLRFGLEAGIFYAS